MKLYVAHRLPARSALLDRRVGVAFRGGLPHETPGDRAAGPLAARRPSRMRDGGLGVARGGSLADVAPGDGTPVRTSHFSWPLSRPQGVDGEALRLLVYRCPPTTARLRPRTAALAVAGAWCFSPRLRRVNDTPVVHPHDAVHNPLGRRLADRLDRPKVQRFLRERMHRRPSG